MDNPTEPQGQSTEQTLPVASADAQEEGLLPMADPLAPTAQVEQPALGSVEQAAADIVGMAVEEAKKTQVAGHPRLTNVVQEFEVFLPPDGGKFDEEGIVLPLAADTFERTRDILAAQPNIDPTTTEKGQEWAYYFNHGQRSAAKGDYFQRTVVRDASAFHQVIKSELGALGAAGPTLAENTQGVKAEGQAAVLRVRALMGLGTIVQIPLWHSGFWITFKAPTDGAFLELHRRLTDEKINLGRQTWGLAYGNQSVFFAAAMMEFAMQHVYDTSLKEKSIESIRGKISSLDIPLIAWGLACTIWPKGFQYARAIPDQTNGTTRVVKERLNLSKLLWTDKTQLTTWQITHMAQRHGNLMSNEAVEKYRNEFVIGRGREVEVAPGLKLTLKVPSMEEYLTNGQRWINGIVAMVDKAFTISRDSEARDEYISAQGRASNFRQFSHWVERLDAQGMVVENRETMDEIFDALSANDQIRDKFFQAVRDYMEDSTISLVAVPTFEEVEKPLTLPRFPHLLPMDVLSTFFTLLVQRVNRVVSREE